MSNKPQHLLEEPPILVYPTLAKLLGINAAIIFQQLHFLLGVTEKAKSKYNFIDGQWWVYNSYPEWREYFPWITERTIQNHFLELEGLGIVKSRQSVKHPTDRRKWYTIDYEAWTNHLDSTTKKLRDGHEKISSCITTKKFRDDSTENKTTTDTFTPPASGDVGSDSEDSQPIEKDWSMCCHCGKIIDHVSDNEHEMCPYCKKPLFNEQGQPLFEIIPPDKSVMRVVDEKGVRLVRKSFVEDDKPQPITEDSVEVVPVDGLPDETPRKNGKPTPEENKAIGKLIKVWIDEQSIIDSKAYTKTGYRSVALDLHRAGITPDDLQGFIVERKTDPFWKDKTIPWGTVQKDIATWKATTNGKSKSVTEGMTLI